MGMVGRIFHGTSTPLSNLFYIVYVWRISPSRTYVGSIQNHQQVCDGLDSLGDSASKIWNVARWTADRIWDATGEIPNGSVLKSYMKNQSCWKDLNA